MSGMAPSGILCYFYTWSFHIKSGLISFYTSVISLNVLNHFSSNQCWWLTLKANVTFIYHDWFSNKQTACSHRTSDSYWLNFNTAFNINETHCDNACTPFQVKSYTVDQIDNNVTIRINYSTISKDLMYFKSKKHTSTVKLVH